MPTTSTTKLEALNSILSSVGESPVISLASAFESASATIALGILDEVDRGFQSNGWSFNTDVQAGHGVTNGEIILASNIIRINVDEAVYPLVKVVKRGNKMYDAKNKTFSFSSTYPSGIIADRVVLLEFDDLPEPAKQFIIVKASRSYISRVKPDDAQIKISEYDEPVAFANFLNFEVQSGVNSDISKYSSELTALGIPQLEFLKSNVEEKLKLIQAPLAILTEKQNRLYYQNRVENKTTSASDTYSTYREQFNRIGLTEKEFISLDSFQREEALVIAKDATTGSTTSGDTRAGKFFASGVADKARKLGIRYSDFIQFTKEQQQVFLDGVNSLSENRFSRFVDVKDKAIRIGVRITDFFGYKPEEQEIFLDALSSQNWSDNRVASYINYQSAFKRLGIFATEFVALNPEQQQLLLDTINSSGYSDLRSASYFDNQAKLRKLGITGSQFFTLPKDQQHLLIENLSSYNEDRPSLYLSSQDRLRKIGVSAVDFYSLPEPQQQILVETVNSGSYSESRANQFVANQAKLKRLGIFAHDFFSLKLDQQNLLLESVANIQYDDARSSQFFNNADKFRKIGIEPASFFSLKLDQQQLLLENIATYADNRASDYIANQNKFKSLGIYPTDFFALKPEQQSLLIESIPSFADNRVSTLATGSNLIKLIRAGVDIPQFIGLTQAQQQQLIDLIGSFTDQTRYQTFFTNKNKFLLSGVNLEKFLILKPSEQQNLIDSVSSIQTSVDDVAFDSYTSSSTGSLLNTILIMVGLNPVTSTNELKNSDYGIKADFILKNNLKSVQAIGWDYNTTNEIWGPDSNKNIYTPDRSYLSVDVDKYKYPNLRIVLVRNDNGNNYQLYDAYNNTSSFSTQLEVTAIKQYDPQSIPIHILEYIKYKSAKELAVALDIKEKISVLDSQEKEAYQKAIQEDSELGDYSIFDSYDVARVLDRNRYISSAKPNPTPVINSGTPSTPTQTTGPSDNVKLSQLTQEGGDNKVLQYTSAGNIKTGTNNQNAGAFAGKGNILLPDQQGIQWLTEAGNYNGAGIRMWEDHDNSGGELIIDSPNRVAIINSGGIQIGDNSTAYRAMHPLLTSGYADASKTLRHSPAVSFQTSVWKNNTNTRKPFVIQAVPQNVDEVHVRGFFDGTIQDEDGRPNSGYTQNSGIASGNMCFELTPTGLWTPGTSPSFVTPSQTGDLTLVCDKHKTFQNHAVVLTGNKTLVFQNLQEGMRGTLIVKQDGTGNRTLQLPGGSLSEAGFTLSTIPLALDRIEWVYTPLGLVFSIIKNLAQTIDADAQNFLIRASVTDPTQSSAVSSLVVSLKLNSLWSKFHAIYPFVGGNATAHSKNLLTDSRHITWYGGLTHNANGVTGNGTSGYGIADFRFSSISGAINSSFGYAYSKTQSFTQNDKYFFGVVDSAFNRFGLKSTSNGTNVSVDGINYNGVNTITIGSGADYRRHFAISRTGANTQTAYCHDTAGNLVGGGSIEATPPVNATNFEIGILARNYQNFGADNFSSVNIAFMAFGQGLTSSEYAVFRGIVNDYQTALSRANP